MSQTWKELSCIVSSLASVAAWLPLELAALLPLELFEALLLPDFCEPRADLQDINHAKRLYALLPETSQASSKKSCDSVSRIVSRKTIPEKANKTAQNESNQVH